MSQCRNELKRLTQERNIECKVVLLPDFFFDRLINLEWDAREFSSLISEVVKRKGGSVDGVPQTDMQGGNAVNVALALMNLGAEVTPIVCTNQFGLQEMKYYFREAKVDLSHVKVRGKASITTALEFEDKDSKTNVMIRDLGALADFSPDDLTENDYAVIDDADYVCLFNWAGTLNHGTQLAQSVFHRKKDAGRGKTYYDTADPSPNRDAIPDLIQKILKSGLVDVFSMNENEAIIYAGLLEKNIIDKKVQLCFPELAMESARVLSKHLPSRIDLHTSAFSATLRGKTEVVSPTFKIKVLRATGAGDTWTAGNILGDHNGLSDECRLDLANAVAACYLSDAEGKHPSWDDLARFLNRQQ